MFRNYIKKVFYIIVLIGFSSSNAGSYDDFFTAIVRDDDAAIGALLARGFDPNTVDSTGTAGLLLALQAASMKVASRLATWPATKVEVRNAADESPLMHAALKGEIELCKLLIKRGADVNKPGWAPLHYAATKAHIDIMNLLLDEHAYIDAASPNGTTPLMMAAQYGDENAVKLLLEAGADPLLRNVLGMTALDFAQRANRLHSVSIIAAFVRGRQPKGSW
jgi:ankyrin repeat protein